MQVVVVLSQVITEPGVILPSVEPEEFGTCGGNVHPPLRLIVAESLGAGPDVGAQVGVRWHRGSVHVEAVNVGVEKPFRCLARAAMYAVEVGQKVEGAESLLICEQNVSGDLASIAQQQALKARFVRGDDPLASAETLDDFTEVAGQGAGAAEGVDNRPRREW